MTSTSLIGLIRYRPLTPSRSPGGPCRPGHGWPAPTARVLGAGAIKSARVAMQPWASSAPNASSSIRVPHVRLHRRFEVYLGGADPSGHQGHGFGAAPPGAVGLGDQTHPAGSSSSRWMKRTATGCRSRDRRGAQLFSLWFGDCRWYGRSCGRTAIRLYGGTALNKRRRRPLSDRRPLLKLV